ncbi:UBP-type zinc finger domain-containing protein [Patescibacteria group bacterium]|nr:UBP-type zinc finger domain-containing protein [Patescibacteria group bacterium]
MKSARECPHYPKTNAKAQGDACQECASDHSLRVCSTCGHVGCCDSQAGHARTHSEEAGHQVMKSYPAHDPNSFTWCYACNDYLETAQQQYN